MVTLPDRREFRLYVALMALSTMLFMAGSMTVSHMAINQILAKEAAEQAESFRTFLIASTDSLGDFLAGKPPSTRTTSFLANTPRVGSLYRYKLFSGDGHARFISDELDFGTITAGMLELPGRKGAKRLEQSQPLIETRRDGRQDGPEVFSAVYLPLTISDQNAGTLVALIDQTDAARHHSEQIREVCLKIGGLSALVFALPLLAALWQVRLRRQADQRVAHMARFDSLTGLVNRAEFSIRLEQYFASGGAFAVHLIDLDKFKEVNDFRGHGIGDLLLREVAMRLKASAGEGAEVARLGGDEFAILHRLGGEEAPDPAKVASAVVEQLGLHFYLDGYDVQIGGSVGTALSTTDGSTIEDLLRAADTALYAAKNAGRSRAVAFVPAMDEARLARLALEAHLRDAVAQNTFDLHFQPIFEAITGHLEGFEALLRLNWPDGKPISPIEFIPVAEDMGLIEEIGQWVMREACRVACLWPEHLKVSVNISALQFKSGMLPEQVGALLMEVGLAEHRLCLELTEGILMENTEKVISQLRAIRSQGVTIALDDFGTGYSSLSYLSCFPLDRLKIDKSLTRDLAIRASKSREIAGAIIGLGHVLNLAVTVEGVETAEQHAILKQLGCDHVQGYLMGRPVPQVDVAAVIARDLVQRTSAASVAFERAAEHSPIHQRVTAAAS